MHQLETVHYVAARYPHLRGLRLLPLAVPFVASAAWRLGWLRWLPGTEGHGAARWFFGAFALALLVSWALGGYYQRRFGVVVPVRRLRAVFYTLAFAVALAVSLALPLESASTISLPMVVIAMGIAAAGLIGGRLRLAYLAVATACLVFGALRPLGVPFHARDVLFDGLIAVALLTIGISDHRLLSSAQAPEAHGRSV